MPPRTPRAEPTTGGLTLPAPLLAIVAKIRKTNPAMFKPFEALTAIEFAKPKPRAINLNPPKALKVLATRDKPKPTQDLIAISKRANVIKAANLKPAASIFKTKSFAEKSRFSRAAPSAPTDTRDERTDDNERTDDGGET